jgi:High potential iron-sulfur protein
MSTPNRRTFIMQVVAAGSAVVASRAMAQTTAKLEETDPQAVALGYTHDTKKVDAKKFPKHVAAQKCNNCQLYQGKGNDPWGPCQLFPGKQVAANGWCSAWVKKA